LRVWKECPLFGVFEKEIPGKKKNKKGGGSDPEGSTFLCYSSEKLSKEVTLKNKIRGILKSKGGSPEGKRGFKGAEKKNSKEQGRRQSRVNLEGQDRKRGTLKGGEQSNLPFNVENTFQKRHKREKRGGTHRRGGEKGINLFFWGGKP